MACNSMTGFGRGEVVSTNGDRIWTTELRSVNNRFLDVKIKIPREYIEFEEKIKKVVNEFHHRGRVDVTVTVRGDFSDLVEVNVNKDLAKAYKKALLSLGEDLDIVGGCSLEFIAKIPEVLTRERRKEDMDEIWPTLERSLRKSLTSCHAMRSDEGVEMASDLVSRLQFFRKSIRKIESSLPVLISQRAEKLQERLGKLLDNQQLDVDRLAQEVAIIADKTDVTEEIVRLKSHLKQFHSTLETDGSIGRKLDFLLQEFLREVNTLASKINDTEIAHLMVELKSELEKMREQVQNIE